MSDWKDIQVQLKHASTPKNGVVGVPSIWPPEKKKPFEVRVHVDGKRDWIHRADTVETVKLMKNGFYKCTIKNTGNRFDVREVPEKQ